MHPSLLSLFDLAGKSAIVTGASRGLGVSLGRGLAKAGCDRTLAARNIDQAREVAADLEQYGFFRSDQTIWAFEENKELGQKLLARVPMGRLGALEELEGTIVYMVSGAAGYMTGQPVVLDGGFLSW